MIPKLGAELVTPACVNVARENEAGRQRVKGLEVQGRFSFLSMRSGVPTGVRRGRGVGLAVLHCSSCSMGCVYSRLGSIQVGLFLKLADIFLVPDPFVAKPVGYLRGRAQGGGAEESDVRQPQHRALSSVTVSRCHVWVHQVPNSQPLQ